MQGTSPTRRAGRRSLATVVALACALTLAACGGSDDGDAAGGSTTTERPTKTDDPSPVYPAEVMAAWEMDEPEGATVLVDSSPNGLDGTIGPDVTTGVVEQGAVAHRREFVAPDAPPVAAGRLTAVPHDDRLNPGTGDFAVTVRLRTTSPQGNVVQKGQVDVPGGYFKLDMDEGRIACQFLGAAGKNHVRSPASIADDEWHEVRCVRAGQDTVLLVDGVEVARRTAPTGAIDNTFPVTIAGKLECDQVTLGCDYFSGDLDRVLIERTASLSTPTTVAG